MARFRDFFEPAFAIDPSNNDTHLALREAPRTAAAFAARSALRRSRRLPPSLTNGNQNAQENKARDVGKDSPVGHASLPVYRIFGEIHVNVGYRQ